MSSISSMPYRDDYDKSEWDLTDRAWFLLQQLDYTIDFSHYGVDVQEVCGIINSLGNNIRQMIISGISCDMLIHLDINFVALLKLKPQSDFEERLAATISIGESKLWSSKNFNRHLQAVRKLIFDWSPNSARPYIEAFLFRAAAMLQDDRRMTVTMEDKESSPFNVGPKISPLVHYTIRVTAASDAGVLDSTPSFLVIEARRVYADDYVYETVFQVCKCLQILKTKIIRAALTNGRQWIFIIAKSNDNGDGVSYMYSNQIEMNSRFKNYGRLPHKPDLIAAILAHWIANGHSDIDSDDWFELFPIQLESMAWKPRSPSLTYYSDENI